MATPFDSIGGLLGIDPEQLKQLMAALGPQEEDRKSANMQALTQLGLGLLGTRKGYEWEQLGNAGQSALMARQQAMQGAQAGRMDQVKMAEQLGKLKAGQDAAKKAAEQQQQLAAIFGGSPAQTPGPGQPASAPTNQVDKYRQAAAFYAAQGNVEGAAKLSAIADKMEEEYSTAPQTVRGEDGKLKLVQFGKRGNSKVAEGMTPAEKLHFADAGGVAGVGMDPYTGAPVSAGVPKTVTPDALLSSETQRRGQNMTDARAREGNAIARDGTIAGKVGEFRKEFNSLPQVKAYGEVQPVLQSAREAVGTDTPSADLNLIYAAAKIMDPTSVVRESETAMVIKAGSPAERLMGQWNYIIGGGRLSAKSRAELMAQIESRGRGYESGYKAARKAYEGIAAKNGIPTDQVFIEPFAGSAAAPAPPAAGPTPGAVVGGYRFKGGDPNKRENWVKV